MTKLATVLLACGAVLSPLLSPAPAQAQLINQTWVASNGVDTNPCTRASPCATVGGAFAKTNIAGIISCADSGPFGMVRITKSITIDCFGVNYAQRTCNATGNFVIDIPAGNPDDPLRFVRLRGFTISGGGTAGSLTDGRRCASTAISILDAANVAVEDMVISDFGRGISDTRTGGGRLTVTNTIVRNSSGSGLIVLPSSGGTRIDVAVDNVIAESNSFGMVFASGPRAMVSRSLIANNVVAGIDVEGDAQAAIDNSTISNNGTGLFTFGSAAVLDVSNSNIAFNAQAANGTWFSFGNNRVHRNPAAGTAPTAIGALTHDLGQM